MGNITFGAFFIALSLTKDVRNDIKAIDESGKSKQPLAQILKQLAEFVRAHSSGKQLRKRHANI